MRDAWVAGEARAAPGGVVAVLLALLCALLGSLATPAPAAAADVADTTDRYSLVHGCFALRGANGKFVRRSGAGLAATAASPGAAEPFRMQATRLGEYLLYGTQRDFLARDGGDAKMAKRPSPDAEWTVRGGGGTFTLLNEPSDRRLATAGDALRAERTGGARTQFTFVAVTGCPRYPEMTTDVEGAPTRNGFRYGETEGFLEGHMHQMAFKFLGGAHCGKPWHKYGVAYAMVDCPDHEPDGCGAFLDNALYGDPARCHDTVGWPTFKDWPHHKSLTHEQSYYKWVERAYLGGLRVFVNLMVQNRVLCELYPFKGENNECDDTKTVYIEIDQAYKLQDYIDAQSGGPGKGWYRIVRNPFEARKVINEGKLAVVLGMEVSEPFGCRMFNGVATCSKRQITAHINRLQKLGVRQYEITNKFDNALTGVAGDSGELGLLTNSGNFYATGRFWDLETCTTPEGEHDHTPTAVETPHNEDLILGNMIRALMPGAVAPVYPPPPHCNKRGLTELGEHALRQLAKRKLIFDPDHMSVKGRDQALTMLESFDYPGTISSHSWSTPMALPRIYGLGGVITPAAGDSEEFVHKWEHAKSAFRGRQYFGLGFGADQNGFATQGGPRGEDAPNPVTYPFRSFNGEQTIKRNRSGRRVWDVNTDGVAHYGMYVDWVEDLRKLAGDEIVEDLGRGSEAYLQMWERAEGITEVRCRPWRGRMTARGFDGRLRLGAGAHAVLRRAGQPVERTRTWRWCSRKTKRSGGRRSRVAGVFDKRGKMRLIGSSGRTAFAAGVRPGDRRAKAAKLGRRAGGGLFVRRAGKGATLVFGTRGKRVSFVAVADRKASKRKRTLRKYVRRSGLR
jgi:microsomal dipeptidase-like Zn-dependent dipeptidase